MELGQYPMVKCNISDWNVEKIYHLPFDQQYDKCIIEKDKSEFCAVTIQEAEEVSFRRAERNCLSWCNTLEEMGQWGEMLQNLHIPTTWNV